LYRCSYCVAYVKALTYPACPPHALRINTYREVWEVVNALLLLTTM
jgi:predicted metal-binding protein